MAITKLSNSGMTANNLKYDSMLAGNDPGATFLIQRIAGDGSSRTITFSNIPQNYQHLQLRIMGKYVFTTVATPSSATLTFNGDATNSAAYHLLRGNGSTVSALGATAQSGISIYDVAATTNSTNTNIMGVAIVDIHDYTSTTKNKTVRSFSGFDNNTATTDCRVDLSSGLWINTSAITSFTVTCDTSTSWSTQATFALYGFIGA